MLYHSASTIRMITSRTVIEDRACRTHGEFETHLSRRIFREEIGWAIG